MQKYSYTFHVLFHVFINTRHFNQFQGLIGADKKKKENEIAYQQKLGSTTR